MRPNSRALHRSRSLCADENGANQRPRLEPFVPTIHLTEGAVVKKGIICTNASTCVSPCSSFVPYPMFQMQRSARSQAPRIGYGLCPLRTICCSARFSSRQTYCFAQFCSQKGHRRLVRCWLQTCSPSGDREMTLFAIADQCSFSCRG